jgi:N-acetylmuramoyl-L-alanine amidase
MRPIDLIVIHCSASPNSDSLYRGSLGLPGFQTPVIAINEWHKKRGFKRDPAACARFNSNLDAIGYHYVIYRNGALATGRDECEIGAHVTGFNKKSLGICLVGIDHFRTAQWAALTDLVTSLKKRYPEARIVGHRDLSPDLNKNGIVESFEWLKTCPGFDVAKWLSGGMSPVPEATQEI